MELREKIIVVIEGEVSVDMGYEVMNAGAVADAILAIPEIAEALALRDDLKSVAKQISERITNA